MIYVTINNLKLEVIIVSSVLFILSILLASVTSDLNNINKLSAMGPSPISHSEVYQPHSNSVVGALREPELDLTPLLTRVMEICPGGCIYYDGCIDEGECIEEGYICKKSKLIESCGNKICEYECETPDSCDEDCGFKISFYGNKIDSDNYYIGWTSDYYKYPDLPRRVNKKEIYLYEIYENEFKTDFDNGNREIISSVIENETIKENIQMILKIDSANCMVDIRRILDKEGEILDYYKDTKILVLETPWYLVDDISRKSCVRKVYPDNLVGAELDISTKMTKSKEVWNMIKFHEYCYEIDTGFGTHEECITLFPYVDHVKGEGIQIAFVDSGIDTTHEDFEGKIDREVNIIDDSSDATDGFGHGTHCASIALGTGESSNTYIGNAPSSEIWAIKAMDSGGWAMLSDIHEGIEYTADPNSDGDCSDHVDILSLSFGIYIGSDGTSADSIAVQHVMDCGTLVVKSAGNQGEYGHGSITSPGDLEEIITVGAIDKENNMYYRSSIGPVDNRLLKPDLVAPGVSIIAARAHDSEYWSDTAGRREVYDGVYTNATGTSMAGPQVAGAAALIMSENNDLTNEQIKSKLMLSATPLGNSVFKEGAGKLNTLKALHCPIATYPQSLFFYHPDIEDSEDFEIHNLGKELLAVNIRPILIYNEDGEAIGTAQATPETFYLGRNEIEKIELTLTNLTDETWQYGRIQILVRPHRGGATTNYNIPFGIKK